jgi:hypothetical protein
MMKAIGAFHLMALVVLTMNAGAQHPDTSSRSEPSGEEEHQRKIQDMRERGEQIRQRLADEYRKEKERIQRERREAYEQRQTEARSNVERLRYGYGAYNIPARSYAIPTVTPAPRRSYYSYGYSPDDSEQDEHRSAWALGVDDRRSPTGRDEQERASQQDEGFAAASGKCGDVTTQKIGNFYYHSNGGVTQKIGNFFYGPDGEVTQKIGNFYHHSDGTTTQRIGNFYYDSDGGVTQKIGSFYYHSGGKPCEDEENE